MPLPSGELMTAGLVAGAVLGVLAVLGTLLAIVGKLDARYFTRAEAVARLDALQQSVNRIDAAMTRHVEKG